MKKPHHEIHAGKKTATACTLLFILVLSCGSGPLAVESVKTGSQVDILYGTIENGNLTFTFPPPTKGRHTGDLFNHLYFEGDTLCFSYRLSRRLREKQARIRFINPSNGKAFPVERKEVYRYRVFGFSLVGSIMEKFYSSELQKPVPGHRYCCRDIPFILEATFRDRGEEITHRHGGHFRITYSSQAK